jgi:uncharacterized membrane protein
MGLVAAETLSVGFMSQAQITQCLRMVVSFLFVAAVSCISVVAFYWFGAWPVVPFAGIELAVLRWALRRTEAPTGDFEKITLEISSLLDTTRLSEKWPPTVALPARQRC